jgi:hypothetical protein
MKRLLVITALVVLALAVSASSWAGSVGYYSSPYWSPGMGGSTAFGSGWFYNVMNKTAMFDSTITFIDNTSYSWHSTVRGPGQYLTTHWLSSAVKKAHCRSNVSASAWAGCGAQN